MSIVIAVMTSDKIVMAGDTQLNNEHGPIQETGMKVFPIGTKCLVGLTGNYYSYMKAVDGLKERKDLNTAGIEDVIDYIKNIIKGEDNNAIIAELMPNSVEFTTVGKNEYSHDAIHTVVEGSAEVKVLLPPDVTEEFCRPYITSMDNLRGQVINCINAVSKISDTVDNRIWGFELNRNGGGILQQ